MDRGDMCHPECRIALTDFGTATAFEPGQTFGDKVGTKMFWAPEIFTGRYNEKVDVWANGVLAFGLVTGRFPFRNGRAIRQQPVPLKDVHVSGKCKDLLEKMLNKDPNGRPTADAVTKHAWFSDGEKASEEKDEP